MSNGEVIVGVEGALRLFNEGEEITVDSTRMLRNTRKK